MKRMATALLAFASLALRVGAIEFSEEVVADKKFTVCRVQVLKEKLELFLRDDSGQPLKRFDRLSQWLAPQGKTLAFAMNAGMYHGDFTPVGLFVAEGREVSPLNLAAGDGNFFLKPNGVFAVTAKGATILESSQYPALREKVLLATQSGPLLVRAGQIHPVFKADSKSKLYRNGVGVPSPEIAIFAISESPVTFHEFAVFFRDALHCPNALFLDGTISSLHAPKLNRSDFKMDLGPIIGITAPR